MSDNNQLSVPEVNPAVEKARREMKEFLTQFKDQKNPRQMWQTAAQSMLVRKALKPIPRYKWEGGKEGGLTQTEESQIESAVYEQLVEDCGGPEFVTEYMMINACQAYLARTSAANSSFVRDTSGGKPIDESKNQHNMSANPYENLDNEQLQVIATALEELEKKKQKQLEEELNDRRQINYKSANTSTDNTTE